jgi:hypothetical protein
MYIIMAGPHIFYTFINHSIMNDEVSVSIWLGFVQALA